MILSIAHTFLIVENRSVF